QGGRGGGEIGKGLHGAIGEGQGPGDDERGEAQQDEEPLSERGADEALDEAHGYGSSDAGPIASDLSRNAPAVATVSPSSSPRSTSIVPSTSGPATIARRRNRP